MQELDRSRSLYLKISPSLIKSRIKAISILLSFTTHNHQMDVKGKVGRNLFRTNYDSQFRIVQIYMDDISFGAINESLCKEFSKLM
ncbi:hypothetical protein CR513_10473, partial [Mucuna pruriens]